MKTNSPAFKYICIFLCLILVFVSYSINRKRNQIKELKNLSTSLFEVRKENINFINMWKRNIAVYLIAECKEIEKRFEDVVPEENNGIKFVSESYIPENEEKDEGQQQRIVHHLQSLPVHKQQHRRNNHQTDPVGDPTEHNGNSQSKQRQIQNRSYRYRHLKNRFPSSPAPAFCQNPIGWPWWVPSGSCRCWWCLP